MTEVNGGEGSVDGVGNEGMRTARRCGHRVGAEERTNRKAPGMKSRRLAVGGARAVSSANQSCARDNSSSGGHPQKAAKVKDGGLVTIGHNLNMCAVGKSRKGELPSPVPRRTSARMGVGAQIAVLRRYCLPPFVAVGL